MRLNFWRQQFKLAGDEAGIWALEARRLKRSADTVFREYLADLDSLNSGVDPRTLEHVETSGPASLLYGLAIENLLKASIIKRGGSRISN